MRLPLGFENRFFDEGVGEGGFLWNNAVFSKNIIPNVPMLDILLLDENKTAACLVLHIPFCICVWVVHRDIHGHVHGEIIKLSPELANIGFTVAISVYYPIRAILLSTWKARE